MSVRPRPLPSYPPTIPLRRFHFAHRFLVALLVMLSARTATGQRSAAATGSAATPVAPLRAPVPPFILRGLEQFGADSADAAIATWTAAWSASADSGKATTLLASLRQIRELAGAPLGFEVVGTEAVGLHLRRVYVLLRYGTQPIFAQFVAYSPRDRPTEADWKLATVTWNTSPGEAWPPSVWVR